MAERIALLDVNVLITLVDHQHVHHEPSHRWFEAHGSDGWASCPLTQNAMLRILGNPCYPNSTGGQAVVMLLLRGFLAIQLTYFGLMHCPGMLLASCREMRF